MEEPGLERPKGIIETLAEQLSHDFQVRGPYDDFVRAITAKDGIEAAWSATYVHTPQLTAIREQAQKDFETKKLALQKAIAAYLPCALAYQLEKAAWGQARVKKNG